MFKDRIQDKLLLTEENFNSFLPEYLQKKSRIFFTPIRISQIATQWLTSDGKKNVLDIGAGVGKFCIAGATYSNSNFFGVEYRPSLAKIANQLIKKFEIENATVLNQNILDVDFTRFNAFYMYNPFYENVAFGTQLNYEVELGASLYSCFFKHTEEQLDRTKIGTRLVTFHGNNYEVPDSFEKIKESDDYSLKLWIRK